MCDPALIAAQATQLLDRRRWDKPASYHVGIDRCEMHIAAAVLSVEGVPIGTLHVSTTEPSDQLLIAVRDLAMIVSNRLEHAELEIARASAAIAELRALRAQISPHFIHNSLTAIAGFINDDPGRARSLLSTFAEFLRATFRTDAEFTTLADELRLVDIYLELERARFGTRFTITLKVAPEVLSVELPFLSVQPIVENAIRHGLEHRSEGGRLSIVAEDVGAEAQIVIEDDGVGTNPDDLLDALQGKGKTRHLGVLSVDERLRSAFGPAYGLVISTDEQAGTKVTMRLPKYRR